MQKMFSKSLLRSRTDLFNLVPLLFSLPEDKKKSTKHLHPPLALFSKINRNMIPHHNYFPVKQGSS